MKRGSVPLSLAGLLLAGCSGKPLDAGTTYVLASTAPPSTLATVTAQIDAITMDTANLYFTCEDGWVYSLSKSTSMLTKIAPAGPAAANGSVYTGGIAVDDTNVYWTADATGQVDGQLLEAGDRRSSSRCHKRSRSASRSTTRTSTGSTRRAPRRCRTTPRGESERG
jgi:outer membrane protein assembly factor BamB